MAGTRLTSGYDVVLQLNANNFAAAIEANSTIRTALGAGTIPVGPPAFGSLSYSPPGELRFYRSGGPSDTFDLDLSILDARWTSADGTRTANLGSGRSSIRVPFRLQPDTPSPMVVRILLQPNAARAEFLPVDDGGLPPDVTLTNLRDGLRISLAAIIPVIDLTGGGLALVADTVPDPIMPGQVRGLDAALLNGSGGAVDAVAFALRILRPSRPLLSSLMAAGSNVGPLEGGALLLGNGFVFSQVSAALASAGIPRGAMTIDSPPTTLAIAPSTNAFGARVLSFGIVATGNQLTLSTTLQLPVPTHTVTFGASGPISFAFARGGNLVVGTNLTTDVDVHINGLGAFIIGILAVAGAVIGAVTGGAGGAAVAGLAVATGAVGGYVIGRALDALAIALIEALGPNLELQLETAFQRAGGGVIPMNLLTGLGATLNFEPPVVFDDLAIGTSLRAMSPVGELRAESGIAIAAGSALDLDGGAIVDPSRGTEADLVWDRALRGGPSARLVVMSGSFLSVTHADLVRLVVGPGVAVATSSIPVLDGSGALPEPLVVGVRTDQLRYAKAALWTDRAGRLIVRYVVYNDLAPNARIVSAAPAFRRVETVEDPGTSDTLFEPLLFNFRDAHEGVFRVLFHRLQAPVTLSWQLGGYTLSRASGVVGVGSELIGYSIRDDTCVLRTPLGASLRAQLRCSVTDATGVTIADEQLVAVRGTRSEWRIRGAELLANASFRQLTIDRAYVLPGEWLPDPPPDRSYRVTAAGIEEVTNARAPEAVTALDPRAVRATAELAMRRALEASGGESIDVRIG